MKRLVFVQNDSKVDEGSIFHKEVEVLKLKAWDEPWEQITLEDYVIVLGGNMGVYDKDKFKYLDSEQTWIQNFVESNGKFLGICLGSQLLASSIGGDAYLSEKIEFGIKKLNFTSYAPLLNKFSDKNVFTWHRDTFSLPDGVDVLASTDYPQIFIYNSAIGLQFHPEITVNLFDVWSETEDSKSELEANGYSLADVRDQLIVNEKDMQENMNGFIDQWIFSE